MRAVTAQMVTMLASWHWHASQQDASPSCPHAAKHRNANVVDFLVDDTDVSKVHLHSFVQPAQMLVMPGSETDGMDVNRVPLAGELVQIAISMTVLSARDDILIPTTHYTQPDNGFELLLRVQMMHKSCIAAMRVLSCRLLSCEAVVSVR